ncbi:MAG: PorT family protein [Taibaiella sp.]|nr:PorT family protein [Taibaiella sp.]
MKFKMLLAAFTAATFFSINTQAQLGAKKITRNKLPMLTMGVKIGVNMQQLAGSGNAVWGDTYNPGIVGGAFASVHKRNIGVRVEALIKTAKFDFHNSNLSVNTLSLDIPALFEYKIIKRVWLQAGPMYSSMIKAKASDGSDIKGNFTTSDLSVVGGVEVSLPRKFTVGARYIKGLINVNRTATDEIWKNTSFQFSVGYRFLN